MATYKCIEAFGVDNTIALGEHLVEVGTYWVLSKDTPQLGDVRLEDEYDEFNFIEISQWMLDNYFECVKESITVLVCGSRYYCDYGTLSSVLEEQHSINPITKLIQGGCNGADTLACIWARRKGIEVLTFMAEWDKYGKVAGPMRNQRMVEEKPDMVIAFDGGFGTYDMVRRAKLAKIPVITISIRVPKHLDAAMSDGLE